MFAVMSLNKVLQVVQDKEKADDIARFYKMSHLADAVRAIHVDTVYQVTIQVRGAYTTGFYTVLRFANDAVDEAKELGAEYAGLWAVTDHGSERIRGWY